ncbi:MazG nucleotide pyrophosphohydrolase domain-containing protein [Pseudomonas sp. FEN]|uniref:MazG nucleotide pyrophosphohydrolase domain-containing protein n=1 Tax=Pseudomonas sp. FEN TaxID=2767468 RepID=UPI00174E0E30|nr:MazG nucleotide pyrophosphohydrolase domain-containing protein [Pseudomonas sp. FEN]CAD5197874.1 hypothetical protein [Pseudomonas sp. FEN]
MKKSDEIIISSLANIFQLQEAYGCVFGTYDKDKACLWLTEEVGELIRAIRRNHDLDDITGELGDILVWIFSLMNTLEIDGRTLVEKSILKELDRQRVKYGADKVNS